MNKSVLMRSFLFSGNLILILWKKKLYSSLLDYNQYISRCSLRVWLRRPHFFFLLQLKFLFIIEVFEGTGFSFYYYIKHSASFICALCVPQI